MSASVTICIHCLYPIFILLVRLRFPISWSRKRIVWRNNNVKQSNKSPNCVLTGMCSWCTHTQQWGLDGFTRQETELIKYLLYSKDSLHLQTICVCHIYIDMADTTLDPARSSLSNDGQVDLHCRTFASNGIRQPYHERIRLKKIAQRRREGKDDQDHHLAVGSLTGRGQEVVYYIERRKVNIICVCIYFR